MLFEADYAKNYASILYQCLVITTAHAHKSGVIFHFFPRAFKQKKIKALRPKMTKIASKGGPALNQLRLETNYELMI